MKYGKPGWVWPFILGGFFFFAGQVWAQEEAVFREVSGTVEVKVPGAEGWAAAAAGDRIGRDTLISTGFKSTATLAAGNSVITVRPVTRLKLEEIIREQDGEKVNLYLQTGRVRADVKPPAGGQVNFTVRSPSATASVRGTSFEFDTENLRVEEGRVVYSLDNGRGTAVAAGGTSYVDETDNRVISPFEAAAELLTPALPTGSGSGGPLGDHTPVVIPPPEIIPSSPGSEVDINIEWD